MEQFRQRIMKDLLELEEAALKEKPKKVISEEGNVKTIYCDGDLAVLLSTPLLQSFVGHFHNMQSSRSQLAGFGNWDVIYNDLIRIIMTESEKFSECSLQLKMKSNGEDEVESLVVFAHALAVYSIYVLRNVHLQHISSRIQSDVISWTAKIFRFSADRGFVVDSATSGLVKICHFVIRQKYPEFSELGYETLQRMPPVVYIGRSSAPRLRQSLCSQLLLPVSSICLVETEMSYDFSEAMDLTLLQTHITRHKAENKVPLLLIAYAGSSCMGQVDQLTGLREICDQHGIWLHVEGNDLSTLSYLNVPINIVSSRLADSLTLAVGPWLGLPCLPSLTLYKSEKKQMNSSKMQKTKEAHEKEEEEMSDVLGRCLPLWFVLQHLGHDGITKRIEHAFSLAKKFTEGLQKISSIFILKKLKRDMVNVVEDRSALEMGLRERIISAIKSLIIQDLANPSVVFYYHYNKEKPYSVMNSCCEDQLMMDGANKWLAAEVLARFRTRGHHCPLSVVEIEKIGVCMRYCSLEIDQLGRCNQTEFEDCIKCLDEKSRVLDLMFEYKHHLNVDVESHQNLKLVSCSTWDGVGSVRYIPEQLLVNEEKEDTSSTDLETRVDEINCEIHKLVCLADPTIFSLGETNEGKQCIKLGIVPDCEHLKRLLQRISKAGKTVEMRLNVQPLIGS